MDVDISSNTLHAFIKACNDGNNDRHCYELKQRSLKLDHMYSSISQPLLESTPLKPKQTPLFMPVRLAQIYSSTDTSLTSQTEEMNN